MSVAVVEPPRIPDQTDVIKQLNWLYLTAARDALRCHYELGVTRFGLDPEFARWLKNGSDLDFALAAGRAQTLFRLQPVDDAWRVSAMNDTAAALLASIEAAERLGGEK